MTNPLTMIRHFLLFVLFLCCSMIAFSQTTLNTTLGGAAAFSNNNGSGTVTFNFANNSGGPVNITTVEGISGSSGASTGQLWIRTAGPINASTSAALGNISAANGWTLAASGTFTSVANTTTLTTQTFISGASVSIPAGANYGMAVVCFLTATPTTGTQRYHTMVSPNIPTTTFTGGGCTITMGTNISWGGGAPPTTPVNHPRAWLGKITFVPAGPCTAPPTAGTVTTTVSTPCPNTNFTLSLTGGTGGTGQTYQWEISPDNITWSPIAGATNASLTTTQLSSNYYRCVVTCSSQSSTTASLLVTTNGVPLSGNYTINSAAPTAGTNFASFTAFANVINCAGVSGPVTVDVVSGSGPYTEQVIFNQIPGASAVNTLTINGNGEKIQFNSANSALPSTIEFSGTDYTTVNNLIFEGQGATYAMACHLWNDANNNNFNNCTFTSPANGTSTTQVPFSISGSQTSATTTGLSGSNNIVTGCTMNSGYYNTCFVGNSASPNTGNQLINCNIRDQYFYASYNLYQNGMIIRGNTIERPTRTTLSTFYGIYMSTGCVGMLVEKNRIRNPFGSTPTNTGTAYGVYLLVDGTSGNENRIYNNLISDFNSNGATYGLYLTGADYVKAYHNTISFDQTSSTAGSAYGIYNSGTVGGIDIKNNLISITKGGTGTKWGLYYTGTFPASDNNVVNVVPSATNYFGYYLTLNYVTKSAFNTASGKDGNSVEADPIFSNPSLGDYQPTSSAVNNAGAALPLVTTDILGVTRSTTTPDPGCYEFNLSSTDLTFQSITNPVNTISCYSYNEVVNAVIKNTGTDPLDFSLNPVTITTVINGPVSYVVSENLTSGTLAVNQTMNIPLNPSIDLSIDGSYSVSGSISMVGDGNATNDNLVAFNFNVGIIPGTITANQPSPICVSSAPVFTLTGQSGGTRQWQLSTVGSSGPWNNVGTGGTTYSPGLQSADYWVRVESNCNTNYSYSNVMAMVVNNPQLLSTTPGSRCGTGPVNLSATGSAGSNINWYDSPTGGTALYTGSTYTPTVSATTTYYAAAAFGTGGLNSPTMPALGTPFSGNVRGFWFVAPSDFTITSLNAPSTGATQSLAVMKFTGNTPPPIYSLTTNAFTTVFLLQNSNDVGFIPVNIPVYAGEVIGIFGQRGTNTAYASATGPQTITINGSNVTITRMLMQFPLTTTAPQQISTETAAAVGVVNFTYTTGCEGTRVPVVATVNPAPTITVSASTTAPCAGGTVDLTVSSSNDPDYTYTWSSVPSGFSGSGSGPLTALPTANTVYSVFAEDNTTGPNAGCTAYGSVSVIASSSFSGGTLTGANTNLCNGEQTTLSVTGATGGILQWQLSTVSASGPWTNTGTVNTTTLSTGVLSQTTYYRMDVQCQTSDIASNVVTINVNNPTVAGTTPGTICGTGTVTLGATPAGAATINWYQNATGGVPLGTGNTYTTPAISSTTTYYAAATSGGASGSLGLPNRVGATTNSGYADIGLMFTAYQAFNLNSVAIYPVATTPSGNVTVTIALKNSAGTILQSTTASVATSVSPGIKTVVPLNFVVPAGVDHRLVFTSATGGGITGFIREVTTGYTYPYTFPGVASITSAYTGGASSAYYYYFYDWAINYGCEGTRVPVVATVNAAPPITVSNSSICAGQTGTLDVTSTNTGYSYTWMPGNLVGATQSVSPSVTTTYTVTAYDNNAGPNFGCQLIGTQTVTVNVNPSISSLSATPSTINPGCNTSVTLNATTSAPVTALLGNASSTTTTSAMMETPYSAFYESGRLQYLIKASELNAIGFSAGTISSLGFDVTATSAFNQSNYTIKMGHTSATALTGYASVIGSLQTVYGPVVLTPPALGVNTYNFNSAFNWNGTDNVIIEICHDNDDALNTCGICYGTSGTVRYTATAFNSIYGTYNDNSTLCGTGIGTLTVNTVNRPNIYLNGIGGQPTVKIWDPGAMSNPATVSPNVTTTYTVTCTNSTTGCSVSGVQVVTVNPDATISGLAASYTVTAGAVILTGTPTGGVFSGPGVVGSSFDPALAGVGTHTISYLPTGYCVPATVTVVVLPNNAILNLKCYIEGFYIGGGMMQPVLNNQGLTNPITDCDDVVIELHEGISPFATAYTFNGVLQTDGTLTCTFPASAQGNSYYIVVNHRNAMQTWSASPVLIGSVTNYDFSTSDAQAYGNNQVLVGSGVYAFYSGDVNQDLSIDAFDYLLMDPDIYNGAGGWLPTDLNGDGSVDAFDYLIYDPNGYNGITVQSP